MYSIILDTVEPNDRTFLNWLSANDIVQAKVLTFPEFFQSYLYVSEKQDALVTLINDWYQDPDLVSLIEEYQINGPEIFMQLAGWTLLLGKFYRRLAVDTSRHDSALAASKRIYQLNTAYMTLTRLIEEYLQQGGQME